ncbi:MAG: phosphatase PAP2 family protein [Saprospiraceae bacterium]|nr:phosphatase PAP2 family protein [Saprospiraceae bacterium]
MMETILQLDEQLFFIINNDWHNPFLDAIMPYWREKTTWIPLYIALAAFVIYRFRVKGLYFILAVALTVGVADTVSSKLIKKTVKRVRPCNDTEIKAQVDLLVGCGGGYSFTSSHATNHFAVAVFIINTLGLLFRRIRWPFLIWAATIALGQVYVGVHYPIDITVGAIIGSLIGWGIAKGYNAFPRFRLELYSQA